MNQLFMVFAAVEGSGNELGTGAVIAIASIVLVFIILAAIIGITYAVAVGINKVQEKSLTAKPASEAETNSSSSPLNLADEDATVAAIIASIECRNETKQNVKVISVKEIK